MMDENKGQMSQSQGCGCRMCGHGHGHGNFALRLVLGLIILWCVFWLGMQIGEFKGSLESGYGNYGGYSSMHNMYYRSPMMMQGGAMGSGQTMQITPAAGK